MEDAINSWLTTTTSLGIRPKKMAVIKSTLLSHYGLDDLFG
ncbi:hypothetical protein D0466_00605 [Peribacillus glennii]|uniref:Uncharacterized protein n=1 Tax=Peribacillus glennii TaxID=2303991 RepID=A0A372LJJ9_9BACI|nr:hypothetical protein D0466_00605 [Peribacillus glennii]